MRNAIAAVGPAPEGGEGRRNVEVMWLLGRLAPDHKTIATFAKGVLASLAAPETHVEAEGVGVATVVRPCWESLAVDFAFLS
jgi:hypothetical protein